MDTMLPFFHEEMEGNVQVSFNGIDGYNRPSKEVVPRFDPNRIYSHNGRE
jgi:hypothetical protein